MHIAFLLQDTGVIYGAERATISLASELMARGETRIHVMLMRETRMQSTSKVLVEAFKNTGTTVELFPVHHPFSFRLIKALKGSLAHQSIDVLHTVGYKADLHGLLATRRASIPIVSTVHGWLFRPDLKERFYERINLITLKRMQKIIVLSRFYEDILQQSGIRPDRIQRIPSGMNPQGAEPPLNRKGPLVIGMLGRFSYEKNHHMFLRAFDELRKRSVDVSGILAGTGPDFDSIQTATQDLGMMDRIQQVGYMDTNVFFQHVDVLVVCSRIENLSYSVLEAMSHSIPVVATRVGGLPDLIEDGVNGYLVASDDDRMLADRLDTLSQRPDLREQMGRAGYRKLREEFRMDLCAESHLNLYRQMNSVH